MEVLTSQELQRVAHAQQILLSPTAAESPQAWMAQVCEAMKTALGAEQAIFLLTTQEHVPLLVSDVGQTAMDHYLEHFARGDEARVVLEQLNRPFAIDEDVCRLPTHKLFYDGETYNDWYLPNKLVDLINVRTYRRPAAGAELVPWRSDTLVGNILLSGSPLARGPRAGTARTMLALLQPALSAGALSIDRAHRTRIPLQLSHTLDTLNVPVWLFDETGACVHETREAASMTHRYPDGGLVRPSAEQLASTMLRGARRLAPVPSSWTLRTESAEIRLSATFLPAGDARAPVLMVRADAGATTLPTEESLKQRFGLTPQECRVALLRASGSSTDDIAEQLSISINTVRRHTERVMDKLHVRRAAEIGPLLLGLRKTSDS